VTSHGFVGGPDHGKRVADLVRTLINPAAQCEHVTDAQTVDVSIRALPSLSPVYVDSVHLVQDGELVRTQPAPADTRGPEVGDLRWLSSVPADGVPVTHAAGWCWAYPLYTVDGLRGCLVVRAAGQPGDDLGFVLRTLVTLLSAALSNASQCRRELAGAVRLASVTEELRQVKEQLSGALRDLEWRATVDRVLTAAASHDDGLAGMAGAVHQLTGLPTVIEDKFQHLRASAGLGARELAELRAETSPERWAWLLARVAEAQTPVRAGSRLMVVARAGDEVLGALSIVDPGHAAHLSAISALEQGATALAMELTHLRALAEIELPLRRDLVDDLLTGMDERGVFARAAALDHDLGQPHRVVVVSGDAARDSALMDSVSRAAARLRMGSLITRRSGGTVLLATGRERGENLHRIVAADLPSESISMGVGGVSTTVAGLPRSYQQALHAMAVRRQSRTPNGCTDYADLGIYRIIGVAAGAEQIEEFVREWLGPLLDYDHEHTTDLTRTLTEYLDHGGGYEDTAAALSIHRSTLRYRLQRIRELTGRDLTQVETRLNLHVASRVWAVISPAP
jgi:sugar diacid utilization regulator